MTAQTLTILPKTLPSMVLGLPELRSPHHLWAPVSYTHLTLPTT